MLIIRQKKCILNAEVHIKCKDKRPLQYDKYLATNIYYSTHSGDRLNMTLADWITIDCTSRDTITLGNYSWPICNKCLVNMKALFDLSLFTTY